MHTVNIIQEKRDGHRLTREEIRYLVQEYVLGHIPDYQMAAFCMAVFFQGMDKQEITDLTLEMAYSGDVLDLSAIPGKKIDKHSTGGVGDTTTLVVAPLVASCGVPVAKMSGRGLGFTGGTIDKLESIPGYCVDVDPQTFIQQVQNIGLAIVGQTGRLAPADGLLYALRDVTATVESIPLVASSVMSKKLAAGADGLVLDVKVGEGAFMKAQGDALQLAKTMVAIGSLAQKETVALVTDMNQPLGRSIGNALEVKEAILTLDGRGPQNLQELCLELAAEMVVIGGKADSRSHAREMVEEKLLNKVGLKKLSQLIEAQGGDARVTEDISILPTARYQKTVLAGKDGYVSAVHPVQIGEAAMHLGAGRETKDSTIDHAVGIEMKCGVGDQVKADQVIAVIHANDEKLIPRAAQVIVDACVIDKSPVQAKPLIYRRITAKDV